MDKINGSGINVVRKRLSEIVLSQPSIRKFYADLKLYTDRIRSYPALKKLFFQKIGYELDLERPMSFNEKIIWKKLHDRNPQLTRMADKYLARAVVKELLGEEEAENVIVPVYCVVSDPDLIPFDLLPDKFVVKPNHGSQMHIIVNGNKDSMKHEIVNAAKKWLNISYGLFNYEWAYRNIEPKIIVEKLLETKDGHLPNDYKFYCFDGKCRIIRVTRNRFDSVDESGYFDLNWNLLPIVCPGYDPCVLPFEKPHNLSQMINMAEKLSKGLDSIRVDLYDLDDHIYFGEFTHYEASGLARYEPAEFDFELGQYWTIKPNYWKKNGSAIVQHEHKLSELVINPSDNFFSQSPG
jgi:hypothetical protein